MQNSFEQHHPDATPVPGQGGTHEYWSTIDPVVADVFQIMDEQDTWTIEDHERVREMLDRVIRRVKESPKVAGYCLSNPAQAMELMAWMRSSTAMMLLHYSDEDRQEIIDHFLSACSTLLQDPGTEETQYRAATLAVDRFLVFERLAMLSRLFSPDRTERVESAIADATALATGRNNSDSSGDL